MSIEKIKEARQKIENLLGLGNEVLKATPILTDLDEKLKWAEEIQESSIPKKQDVIKCLENTAEGIINWDIPNFSYSDASGSLGQGYSGYTETVMKLSQIYIKTQNSDTHKFLLKYNSVKASTEEINTIVNLLNDFKQELADNFITVQNTYDQWDKGLKTSSDLCKDIRNFLEQFKGELNKLRVPKEKREMGAIPEFSWPKMAKAIVRKGKGYINSLMTQKSVHENLHKDLSYFLKTFNELDKQQMNGIHQRFLKHLYSTITAINKDLF